MEGYLNKYTSSVLNKWKSRYFRLQYVFVPDYSDRNTELHEGPLSSPASVPAEDAPRVPTRRGSTNGVPPPRVPPRAPSRSRSRPIPPIPSTVSVTAGVDPVPPERPRPSIPSRSRASSSSVSRTSDDISKPIELIEPEVEMGHYECIFAYYSEKQALVPKFAVQLSSLILAKPSRQFKEPYIFQLDFEHRTLLLQANSEIEMNGWQSGIISSARKECDALGVSYHYTGGSLFLRDDSVCPDEPNMNKLIEYCSISLQEARKHGTPGKTVVKRLEPAVPRSSNTNNETTMTSPQSRSRNRPFLPQREKVPQQPQQPQQSQQPQSYRTGEILIPVQESPDSEQERPQEFHGLGTQNNIIYGHSNSNINNSSMQPHELDGMRNQREVELMPKQQRSPKSDRTMEVIVTPIPTEKIVSREPEEMLEISIGNQSEEEGQFIPPVQAMPARRPSVASSIQNHRQMPPQSAIATNVQHAAPQQPVQQRPSVMFRTPVKPSKSVQESVAVSTVMESPGLDTSNQFISYNNNNNKSKASHKTPKATVNPPIHHHLSVASASTSSIPLVQKPLHSGSISHSAMSSSYQEERPMLSASPTAEISQNRPVMMVYSNQTSPDPTIRAADLDPTFNQTLDDDLDAPPVLKPVKHPAHKKNLSSSDWDFELSLDDRPGKAQLDSLDQISMKNTRKPASNNISRLAGSFLPKESPNKSYLSVYDGKKPGDSLYF